MKRMLVLLLCLIVWDAPAQTITHVEYWVDQDPGWGQASPLTNFSPGQNITVPDSIVSTLSIGHHVIGIRSKGSNGKWSHTNFMQLRILPNPVPPATGIVEVEYFWNTDPYFDQSQNTVIPSPIEPNVMGLQFQTVVPINSQPGESQYLFVRSRDSDNKWSHTNLVDSVNVTVTSISDAEGGTLYRFYPNPGGSVLWIDVRNSYQKNQLQVMDVRGHLLLERQLMRGKQSFALPQLAAGTYLLRFVNEQRVVSKSWVVY